MGSIEGLSKQLSDQANDCSYVYGTRFATRALPSHQLPDGGMPKEVAYQMIKDDLALDGQPILNLASFVTTYMEDEALKLLAESSNKNIIDHEEYPKSVEIEHRCLNILADLFHSPVSNGNPTAFGTSTIGSSEAIMLAMLAMKKRWQINRQAQGKDASKPNIIMSSGVQVCWEKAAKYFDISEKLVPCTETRYVIDPVQAVDLVDENTIGICAILGTTYTGQYEDVQAISELLLEKGLDTPIHVDAASGGFVAPFVNPDLVWDFKLPNVVSINVSGHKYGLVYPGIGWALWRSSEYLPEDLVFNIDYLGAEQLNFTMNFSKPASHIIAQYYQLIRLGRSGYTSIMRNLTKTADYLTSQLQELGFILMSEGNGKGLPVVAFRLSPSQNVIFDEWALSRKLRERGWIVPAYTMAADCQEMGMMRAVVRTDFSMGRCVSLVRDVQDALGDLAGMEIRNIQRYQALVQSYVSISKKKWTSSRILSQEMGKEIEGI
ncbi:Pyridoxal phosphate-dependent transferase, major region, subdomain 1 [Penicillium expansum]|uniref:Glutamate decarboxylase n=1 Tax=Penicillium expansum TaxID=27334 RepID=A0A0A2IV39_PENEN|nr:Pyridoxal phosphate-dependent transferase, major region, subdomain 1 [Penicillium expansum]KGO46366.1 Pyridoxal phosphate-dependent transferase, major region, subdomain 1 [Penicillium expansum]KGO46394.1 Pyridoxal phosphate-dependent transferase, major region, subdomain 1 [Penicillium expansum]KGO52488.1 Pyridoxal phosphate-dependent transferase, major region, subdomain 1 [Penicillium expansum]